MAPGIDGEAGHEGVDGGVGPDLSRVEVELTPPDQARLLAEIDDLLEEARKDRDAQPLSDPRQAGVVGERFIEGIAQVPAMRQVQTGGLHELALRAEPLEKHDELQFEEHHRIDGRAPALGVQFPRPLPYEAEIECLVEVAIKVVRRDEGLQRDGDRFVEVAEFGRAEHRRSPGRAAT